MKRETENILYGKTLQKIRKKKNLTQEQVAELTGLESKYISQIETGVAMGTIITMLKLCNAYEVTPNDVLVDLIDKSFEPSKETEDIDIEYSKLNPRDKKIVSSLIKNLLEDYNL